MAKVMLNNKIGFFAFYGSLVIEFEYDNDSNFKNGVCIVMKEKYSGLINKYNHHLLSICYDKIEYFNDDILKLTKTSKIAYWSDEKKDFIWTEKEFQTENE